MGENKCKICRNKIEGYPFCKRCDKGYSFYQKELILANDLINSINGLSLLIK